MRLPEAYLKKQKQKKVITHRWLVRIDLVFNLDIFLFSFRIFFNLVKDCCPRASWFTANNIANSFFWIQQFNMINYVNRVQAKRNSRNIPVVIKSPLLLLLPFLISPECYERHAAVRWLWAAAAAPRWLCGEGRAASLEERGDWGVYKWIPQLTWNKEHHFFKTNLNE